MSTTTYPMLYGRASHGTIKVWSIAVEDHANESHIIITHGIENGKQQQTIRKVKAGKNIGRSNETTVAEQARLEAESFWNKKQDKGYSQNRSSLVTVAPSKTTGSRLPMLALKYEDRKHDLVYPVYVQPKLNGVRCLMERNGDEIIFHSRGGKQFTTLDHIKKDALEVMRDGEILDGELYCHLDLTFQQLVSLIKNDKKKEENADDLKRYVHFWNYDICLNQPFRERVEHLVVQHGSIRSVRTLLAENEEELMYRHQRFVLDGYEGTMIRSGGDEPYKFQYRSSSLLKYKDFQDEEFLIIGAKEGVGKDEGKATFRCKTKDGGEFDVRCKGTDDERREQWKNHKKYLNKMLTVKFQSYSDSGVPIFPVGIGIRDYE